MHSSADVEAFTAALNRDIGGGMDTIPGPSDSVTGGISQEGAPRPNEVGEMGQTSGQNPTTLENQHIEQGKAAISNQSKMVGGNLDVSTKLPISQTQTQTLLKMTNQQAQGVNPVSASKKMEKAAPKIPFHMLMPILRPHLDKDRDMQLQQKNSKLRSNEVTKEDFLRVTRNIVGDKMLRQAAHTVHLQMQAQAQATKPGTTPNINSSTSTSTGATSNSNPCSPPSRNPNQYSLLSQATSQQFYPGGFQAAKKVSLDQSPSPSQLQTESNLEPKGPQSIGMFGPSFPRPGNTTPSLRTPTSQSQGMGPGQVGQQNWQNVGTTFGPAYLKYEQLETAVVGTLQQKQTIGAGPAPTRDEFLGQLLPQRIGPGPGTGMMGPQGQVSGTGHQMSHAESNMMTASSGPHHPLSGLTKSPSNKPSVGQKKPAEACTSPPTSKKQKTGGAFLDQSIEQLNYVTAVSRVNLRDESMHSSADVAAFTAALNRDIGGGVDTIPGPSDSATGGISQEGAPRPNEVGEMGQTSGQNPTTLENQHIEQGKAAISNQSKMVGGNPDASTKLPVSQTQTQTLLKMTNQQAQGVNPVSASKKTEKAAPTIPFHMLMPILRPHLDKDRDMQLQQIFSKLRSNEVAKEDFLWVTRNIVGDKMLRQAAHTVHLQMQAQAQVTKPATTPNSNSSTSTSTGATSNSNPCSAPSTNPNQYSLLSQATSQQFYPGGFQAAKKVSLGQSPSPSQLQTESNLELKGPQPMPNRPSLVSPSMQQLTRPPHQHGLQGAHTSIGMFGPSFPRPGNTTPSLRTPTSQSQGMGPGQVGQQNWQNVGTTLTEQVRAMEQDIPSGSDYGSFMEAIQGLSTNFEKFLMEARASYEKLEGKVDDMRRSIEEVRKSLEDVRTSVEEDRRETRQARFLAQHSYQYNLASGMEYVQPPYGWFDIDFYQAIDRPPPPPPQE